MKRIMPVAAVVALVALAFETGCGSNNTGAKTYTQFDRLGRPAVNEVFATVANNRHQINDDDNPTDDASQLANDIQLFMTHTAGRSAAITNAAVSVLVPDVLVADLSQGGPAGYLGVETNGVTGGKFGGRQLTDDVVDTSLSVIFGNAIPSLGLAADDGHEIPSLTTDNVGPGAKHFTNTFPYLGPPQ